MEEGGDAPAVHAVNVHTHVTCLRGNKRNRITGNAEGCARLDCGRARLNPDGAFAEHNLDFGNHLFGVLETAAEGIVLVFVEVPENLVARLEVIVQERSGVARRVVRDYDAQSLVAICKAGNIEGADGRFARGHNASAGIVVHRSPGPCASQFENQVQLGIARALVRYLERERTGLAQVPCLLVFNLRIVATVGHRHLAVAAFLADCYILYLDARLFRCGECLHGVKRGVNRVGVAAEVRFGLVADVLPGECACVTAVKCLAVAFLGRNLGLCRHACGIGIALPAACGEFADNHRLAIVTVLARHLGCRIHERAHRIVLVIRVVVRLEKVERAVRLAARRHEGRVVPVLLILDVHATRRNEQFRVFGMDGCRYLVRKRLNLGKRHLLGGPAAAFARHALGFVENFPGHERLVVANRLHHRDERVVDKRLRAFIFKQVRVRGDVEFLVVKSPLVGFHQVVAEEAHRDHHAVFLGDVQSLLHVVDGVFLEARNQVRRLVDFRALAHVVEKPPADSVTARGARAFHSLAPGVLVQRGSPHVGIVVAPGEVRARKEDFLAVIEQVGAAHREARSRKGCSTEQKGPAKSRKTQFFHITPRNAPSEAFTRKL